MNHKAPMVRLGDLIEVFETRNVSGHDYPFFGVNKDKAFMATIADTNELDNTKYKIVSKNMFVFSGMQTGRDVCIRLALYDKEQSVLISPAYTTFVIKKNVNLCPKYLFMFFRRFEMDRYGAFLSDGSIRSNLDWDRFCEIEIPLPSLEVQQSLVAIYDGLEKIIIENETLIQQLESVCHDFVVDCKYKYQKVQLRGLIEESDERNSDLSIKLSQGISNLKHFQTPKQVAENSRSDKIVRRGQFAYNRATTRNGEKISIAYRDEEDCSVSSSYCVFRITNEDALNPYFLMMFFKRGEFDRYARWRSEGSAHEFFTFEMMQQVAIPLPPIAIQNAIVDLYRCCEECKHIVRNARDLMKNICPALVQKAAHSA